MQSIKQQTTLAWSTVALAIIFMAFLSGLILYPKMTNENVLIALRCSSLTTAIPFIFVFWIKPLTKVKNDLGQWLQTHQRYLWLVLTSSHLIHLYQIFLYYQLGQSCPLLVWLVTAPLWIIMVIFSAVEVLKPQALDLNEKISPPSSLRFWYQMGIWYIWLIFTIAFGLGMIDNHMLFYNLPAFILFLSSAIFYGMVEWQKRIAA